MFYPILFPSLYCLIPFCPTHPSSFSTHHYSAHQIIYLFDSAYPITFVHHPSIHFSGSHSFHSFAERHLFYPLALPVFSECHSSFSCHPMTILFSEVTIFVVHLFASEVHQTSILNQINHL